MKTIKYPVITLLSIFFVISFYGNSYPWYDEIHIAIAKVAGYKKCYNTTGADMAKLKAGNVEKQNHYVNNPRGTIVIPEMVLQLEDEKRLLTKDEAYEQISHSTSLFKAILQYVEKVE
jgi:hypothetical protein